MTMTTTNQRQRLAFIGGGNMASSIIGGLVQSGWSADRITVSDPSEDQCRRLRDRFGIATDADNSAVIADADVVVLAVKPQVLREVVVNASSMLQKTGPLLVSVVAGIPAASTLRWIGKPLPLVRVMPNTPALIGKGVSGLFATSETSDSQRQLATTIMAAVGETVWVRNEDLIDTVTGVSGSGPAYFFKIMEIMIAEGVEAGLEPADAKRLVVGTAIGAAKLLQQSEENAAELRRRVTSPNGTTQAGIEAMEAGGIDLAVANGVQAAIRRSRELSEQFGSH